MRIHCPPFLDRWNVWVLATVVSLLVRGAAVGSEPLRSRPLMPVPTEDIYPAGEPPLPTGPITRIAFGSCAKHWQAQPIWAAVLATKPDLWLFLGDNIYADTDGTTAWEMSEGQLTGEWNRLADKPEWQAFRARVPMLATWDNHDYGSHAGGGEFPHKEIARKAFLTFFKEPQESPRWTRDGVYDARILGPEGRRVQIILLDTKFNRSTFKKDPMPQEERLKIGKVGGYIPDDDPAKTHLGAAQWKWVEEELAKPAEVRLLCSSTQVIPDQKGMDEWGNFPHERRRLLELLKSTGNVVILSGNVHFAEVSQSRDGALMELTSSGMTHINERYAHASNRYRIAGPCTDLNFGLVAIEWREIPVVHLKAINGDGSVVFGCRTELEP